MFQAWRVKLRQAETALAQKRLEEARSLLCQDDLREFYPAQQLLKKLAQQYVQRAESHLSAGESHAGWRDLDSAQQLGADDQSASAVREKLIEHVLAESESYLQADDPAAALNRLRTLETRRAVNQRVRALREAAIKMDAALNLAHEGRFNQADRALEAAQQLSPKLSRLGELRKRYQQSDKLVRSARQLLHDALSCENWPDALNLAEQVLAVAPADPIAREARRRAWAAVGAAPHGRQATNGSVVPLEVSMSAPSSCVATPAGPDGHGDLGPARKSPRFLLWVDGVGGYLVCEGEEIVIGQPVNDCRVDLPILGDLSRNHATIQRCGDGYLLTARRTARVNGRLVTGSVPLPSGCLVELGDGVKLRFRQPHPCSTSAVIEFESRNRTQPPADAVILLGDSCVLGPSADSHVVCRDWPHEVVLFRQQGQLLCRAGESFQVDGQPQTGPAPLTRRSRISATGISVTLEEV
ncbi:MAG: hypothetical protein HYS13_04750 [Planctomycetia bacterium]|nr:hypothetical protein [Planctomycetia bacterium]